MSGGAEQRLRAGRNPPQTDGEIFLNQDSVAQPNLLTPAPSARLCATQDNTAVPARRKSPLLR